jgi:peptide/nickel transport system substrate-binding protein
MTRSASLPLRFAALLGTAAIIAACTGTTASPSAPASEAPGSVAPSASAGAFEGMAYPATGEAPCGEAAAPDAQHDVYKGNFKKISATDANTVVFELCNPDVAFLSKIAFTSFAINDTAWIEAKVDPSKPDNQAIVSEVNGTGPYKLDAWNRGSDVTMVRNDAYWGDKAKTERLIVRWGTEAAQRLVELQAGSGVDGIDNVGATDFPTVEGNADLQLKPREGLNTLYFGFNNKFAPFDNEKVRQAIAIGIDRQRIVDNFSPPGSEVATHFTPCSIAGGCEGQAWPAFDLAAAKQMLADAGFANGFETKIQYRDVSRSYAENQNVLAQDLQAQLATLGITATIEVQESGTFIDNADGGKLDGIHILGWGADYPDATNFLDYHFGGGASAQFGDKFDDITGPLQQGATGLDDASRAPFYGQANDAIRTHVPMIPIAHQGSATAYRADVQGAHSSPLGNEAFFGMTPGDRTQFVFMQGAEPPGLYCADESDGEALRVCEQMMEGLYAYEVAGTAAIPALAESCEPNTGLDVWTCTLRQGVTFHDGATLDANDVVLTYAVQWDADHERHIGRDNSFTYFPALFGGFLNPPVPPPA